MTCSLCGYRFRIEDARGGCSSCAVGKVFSSCGLVKCPNCGYESPKEPGAKEKRRRKRHGQAVHGA